MNSFVLNNDLEIPVIGYGPGIILSPKRVLKNFLKGNFQSVQHDLRAISTLNKIDKTSMVLIDTSASYEYAQSYIGKKIRSNREKYFIVSKVSNKAQFTSNIEDEFLDTISKLKTDYLDLYLLHWPVEGCYIESWKILERLYSEGKCRAIGVANCNIHHLEKLKESANIMPMINQIECHPLFHNADVVNYCRDNKIQVMAYTPTARMDDRIKGTKLPEIALSRNKSVAQIILKWHIQQGRIPIVNTNRVRHLFENCEIFDFELTEQEIKMINSANINSRLRYDPDNCDFSKL